MALVLEHDLKSLLDSNEVPAAVQEWMRGNGCHTLKRFANWCDAKSELEESLLAKVDGMTDDRSALAALKQSWREADALVTRSLKRGAEGLAEEAKDEPLPEAAQRSLEKSFTGHYHWDLPPWLTPCDSLLGRCKREADTWAPTAYSASRVRTVAFTTRESEVKRQKFGDNLTIEVRGEEATDFVGSLRLRSRLAQYDVLGRAWAMTGMADVKVLVEGVEKLVKYCGWCEVCRYLHTCRFRVEALTDRYSEQSVLDYLMVCEEEIRGYALQATRDKDGPVRWGAALSAAMEKHSAVWREHDDMLVPLRAAQSHQGGSSAEPRERQAAAAVTPEKKHRADAQGGQPVISKAKWATAQTTQHGAKVCKKYNDRRGCAANCPDGSAHVCDVVLDRSEQACGSKSHSRATHDPATHGAPRARY